MNLLLYAYVYAEINSVYLLFRLRRQQWVLKLFGNRTDFYNDFCPEFFR